MYRTTDKISATIQKCTTNNIVPRLNELYNLTSYPELCKINIYARIVIIPKEGDL